MNSNERILAVIPARGGSKRLHRKNILNLAGKPLIAWTIDAALKSAFIDKVVVSSDDTEILNYSKSYQNLLTIKRPSHLATDKSSSYEVVMHTIEYMKSMNEEFELVIMLQPSSPLRDTSDIDKSILQFQEQKLDGLLGVCETDHNLMWTNKLDDNGDMSNFIDKKIINKRSQDLEKFYRLNGAIYLHRISRLIEEQNFHFSSNISAFIMPRERSVDIDCKLDLDYANFLINKFNLNTNS